MYQRSQARTDRARASPVSQVLSTVRRPRGQRHRTTLRRKRRAGQTRALETQRSQQQSGSGMVRLAARLLSHHAGCIPRHRRGQPETTLGLLARRQTVLVLVLHVRITSRLAQGRRTQAWPLSAVYGARTTHRPHALLAVPTARGGLGAHTPRSGLRGRACRSPLHGRRRPLHSRSTSPMRRSTIHERRSPPLFGHIAADPGAQSSTLEASRSFHRPTNHGRARLSFAMNSPIW